MYKLAILIPSRDEDYLKQTIEDILQHSEADTEIIVGLDGWKSDFKIWDNPRIQWVVRQQPIGQRAMTNELARLTDAPYLMKIDAHCSFSQGFDRLMLEDMAEDITLVPVLLNLRPYRWLCPKGHIQDHSNKKPEKCWCGDLELKKEDIWETIPLPITSSFIFDSNLIFGYAEKQSTEILTETMAIQGSGWMVSAKKYWELSLSEEHFGSWGMQSAEVACKTWLSGGRLLNTKKAYMGHWFRGTEDFPYQRDMKQVDHAKNAVTQLFLNNAWPHQILPIQWLVRKFNFPADWTEEKLEKLCTPWDNKK